MIGKVLDYNTLRLYFTGFIECMQHTASKVIYTISSPKDKAHNKLNISFKFKYYSFGRFTSDIGIYIQACSEFCASETHQK